MALAAWNVRDLNSTERQLEVKKHLSTKSEVFGIPETKVKAKKFAQVGDFFGEG